MKANYIKFTQIKYLNKKGMIVKFVSKKIFKKFGEVYLNYIKKIKKKDGFYIKNNCLIICCYGNVQFHLINKTGYEQKISISERSKKFWKFQKYMVFEAKTLILNFIKLPHSNKETIKKEKIKKYYIKK